MTGIIQFPRAMLAPHSVRVIARPLNHFRYDVIAADGLIVAQTCCSATAIAAAKAVSTSVTVSGPPEAFDLEATS
jgi:hypothetical protein